MGALPRPDLAPGPARELNDALHALHHRAGWPSLRTLARDAGCSHTTVSHVFSSPRLPTWGVVELLVEAMGGTTTEFHDLWLAASAPSPSGGSPVPRIAGRRAELAAVRRHLETGHGLLLVTGEAGIGKTRLVTTAAAATDCFVATGTCRPLSTEVPLLPVSELFRQVMREDASWFEKALDDSPDYVREAMAHLLPELGSSGASGLSEEWARQRLFHGVGALLIALRERRALGVLVEDGHWADAGALDLLALLACQPVPLVVTWRTDDPEVPSRVADWLARARRLPGSAAVALGPLVLEETAEQLALIGDRTRSTEEVQRIHDRSLGQPLFTEQLALHPDDRPLPDLLADLLMRRLRGIDGEAWTVARALGVADRPLSTLQLAEVSGLEPLPALRELHSKGLLARADDTEVRLRHPLVADAIRHRLAPGEAPDVHRRVASVLARSDHPPAAEIAQHWAGAGDAEEELSWRIQSARAASARFSVEPAARQWQRVLALWPPDRSAVGDLTRAGMYVAALDAIARLDTTATTPLLDGALLSADDASHGEAAAIIHRVGDITDWLGDRVRGMELSTRAVEMYESLPASAGHAEALFVLQGSLEQAGRFREAAETGERAVAVARELGVPAVLKEALARLAWHQALRGDHARAQHTITEVTATVLDPPDPFCEIDVATRVTDLQLMAGAPAEDLLNAARTALTAADTWDLHHWGEAVLRFNVSEAMIGQGDVRRARELVEPHTAGEPLQERWPLFAQRAVLEMLAGRLGEAVRFHGYVDDMSIGGLEHLVGLAVTAGTVDLWNRRPEAAFDRFRSVLDEGADSEEPAMLAALIALAARAAADLGAPERGTELRSLVKALTGDPFARHPLLATPPAYGTVWLAELARLDGHETVQGWVSVAAAWDTLRRPHDAAYGRWRAAQVARTNGEAGLAEKLLRRAARDAREHVPLLTAIRAT